VRTIRAWFGRSIVSERKPFENIDELEEEQPTGEADPTEVGPIVGGMGQMPGSGATGISGAGMAPAVAAGVTRDADEDIREPDAEDAAEDDV
jgi:hypothetical protein